ncbi:response regulator [Tropicibacter sp. S64]|uniref:response regulator n=1 Tax=Tropicibacter sp. S64 TaxID=3415122 RepID=UPI003C7979C8
MDDYADPLESYRRPTATRPLLGLTVLVVEDSRYACDAMRLLCLRSGARIRRADCMASARRHLQVYRPSVVIVDLGLPDGSGADLIAELVNATPRIDVVLGTSGDTFSEDVAMAAGADGFLAKPIESVVVFQSKILSALPPERQPSGPRLVSNDPIHPDPLSFRDDMAHAAEVLDSRGDGRMLDYVAQFLRGVAMSAGDAPLEVAAKDLSDARANGRPIQSVVARVAALIHDRLSEKVAI